MVVPRSFSVTKQQSSKSTKYKFKAAQVKIQKKEQRARPLVIVRFEDDYDLQMPKI